MHHYFSTPTIFSAPSGHINREQGIIQGITIARIGIAKGHEAFIDRAFLLSLVDNAAGKPAGIKARFGHPNMCSSALGTYLGRFMNYSYSGDQVKADLHLDETAKNTPSGDLFTYVLDMAEKNPDMFGASIAFETADSEFLDKVIDGKKVNREYFRLKELRATDIVDDPAATDGLFSSSSFPGLATQFLDENPEIMELIFSKPDSVIEFLSNYLTNTKMNLSDKIKLYFTSFLAALNAPVAIPGFTTHAEHIELTDNSLDTLFNTLCTSFPESFADIENFSQLQKAQALTTFFSSAIDQVATETKKLSETITAFDALKAEHQASIVIASKLSQERDARQLDLASANIRIQELTEQLGARPSIPLNVTDPALSAGNLEKDETGKQILAAMPNDIKRKLKSY